MFSSASSFAKKLSLAIVVTLFASLQAPVASAETSADATYYDCETGSQVAEGDPSVFSVVDGGVSNVSCTGNVVLPEDVTTILSGGFWNTQITSVTIPGSVNRIEDFAFDTAPRLADVWFHGNAPETVGDWAFSSIAAGAKVHITATATGFGNGPTWYGLVVERAPVPIPEDGYYDCATGVKSNDSNVTGFRIESGNVSNIDCTGAVVLPSGLTEIDDMAFYLSAITSITIPSGVTSIGEAAFEGSSSLSQVVLPPTLESIGWYAFGYNTSLTSITIPASVTYITDEAFYDSSIEDFYFLGNAPGYVANYAFDSVAAGAKAHITATATGFGTEPTWKGLIVERALESYTVTFDSKSGSNVSAGSFVAGGSIDIPFDPTRAGYSFMGWSATDGGDPVTFPYSPGVTDDITLYALWSADYSYEFNEQEGSHVPGGTFKAGGNIQTPPSPVRPGYTFVGWSATLGGPSITFPYSPGVTQDITMYAKWSANSYTVTFNSLGGSAVSEQSFTTGGTVAEPTPPTRAGYTFEGWSATNGGSAISFPYTPSATQEITLYALWSANSHTVTFNSKGGSPIGAGSFASGGSINSAAPSSTQFFDDALPEDTFMAQVNYQLHMGNEVSTSESGWVEQVRYYRFLGDDSAISASVWSSEGVLLGTQLFAGGTESGWQSVTLDEPVYISANETFYVSVLTPSTPYSAGATTAQSNAGPWSLIGYAASGPEDSFIPIEGAEDVFVLVDLVFETASVPTPTRAGYTFLGWSATDGGSVISFPYTPGVTEDITLYANWSRLTYDVTFDSKSGSSVADTVFDADGSIAAPTPPTREGYVFLGWSATDGGSTVSFPYSPGVAEDITLYALWSADTHTVTFDSKGGNEVDFDSFVTGGSVTEPFAPTRDGYTFLGWSATNGGAAISFPYTPGVTEDITLYALWSAESYTVTFNPMGGDDVADLTFSADGSLSAPSNPSRSGYTFVGWSATENGSAVSFPYSPGVTEDIVMYALWSTDSYSVDFESNGNLFSTGSFDTDGTLDAPASDPSRAGYTFLGWSDTNGGSVISFPYAPGVSEDITLYALWSADSHNVTFESNGTVVSSGSFDTDGSLTAPSDPTRTGYTFLGWSATNGGSLISFPYAPGVSEDITLYALWSVNSYLVSFDTKGGEAFPGTSFITGGYVDETFDAPYWGRPYRDGYTFLGWSATDGGSAITFPYYPGVTSNIILYALWSADSHSIIFFANGRYVHYLSYLTDGSVAEPTPPTRAGYTFLGWSATDGGSAVSFPYAPGGTGSKTMFALWSVDSHTVSFESNGNVFSTGSFDTAGTLDAPSSDPTRTGYTFLGWSATNGGSAITFPYLPGVIYDITLYALWSADSHTVSFESNGTVVASGSFVTDGTLDAPSDPSRAGYTFLGWSATEGGSLISFPYHPFVTEDFTLYAVWSADSHNVSFESNGTVVSSGSFVTDGTLDAPSDPTRTGYTFLGWSATNGGIVISFPYDPGVIENITLYAKWSINTYVFIYNSKGGTSVASGSFVYGGLLDSAPRKPYRSGAVFMGWSDTDGGDAISFPYSPGVASNVTLYAKWAFLAPLLSTSSESTMTPGDAIMIKVSRVNVGCTVTVGWLQENTGVSSISKVIKADRTSGVFSIATPSIAGRYTLTTSTIGGECSNGTAVTLARAFTVGKKLSVVAKLSSSSAFVSKSPVVTVSGKVKSGGVAVVGKAMTVSLRRNGVEVATATVSTDSSGSFVASFSDINYLAGEYSTAITGVADSTYLASEGVANKLTLR